MAVKNNNTSCRHKFYRDLKLEYVDWEVETLFIGTFNPGCCKKNENSAEWFYGRTQNNMFWNTLGFIYSRNPTLGDNGNAEIWMSFCKKHKIAVTDLIYEVENLDLINGTDQEDLCKGFSDSKLENFIRQEKTVSNEVEILIQNSQKLQKLKCVYLTRRGTNRPWNILWNPIKLVCRNRKIYTAPLTTPGGYNYFQFNNDFPRTPENLSDIWINRNGMRICQ
ncbi:hypothetical protein [Mesoflavibacter zeaxanthinifaciens]|uniref:hypothetical protein n=1 Tax=Mesoflavibacter zeaxanthinifaciens TaxID=393060 RepID=UPI003A8DD8D5